MAASSYPVSITVTNPGAETGDTTGWTNVTGVMEARTSDDSGRVLPRSGTRYFCSSTNTATSEQTQDIALPVVVHDDVLAGMELKARFSGYQEGFSGDLDAGALGISFLDSLGFFFGGFSWHDDFDDPATLDGYAREAGTWAITASTLTLTYGTGVYTAATRGNFIDGEIQATMRSGSEGNANSAPELHLRRADGLGVFVRTFSSRLEVWDANGGAAVLRASWTNTFSASTDYLIRAELIGNRIRVWVNGTLRINYTGITRTGSGGWGPGGGNWGAGSVTKTFKDVHIAQYVASFLPLEHHHGEWFRREIAAVVPAGADFVRLHVLGARHASGGTQLSTYWDDFACEVTAGEVYTNDVVTEAEGELVVDFARDVDLTPETVAETTTESRLAYFTTSLPVPPGLGARLEVDADVLGYWGFDEANTNDVALDETPNAHNLTVTNASGVIAARLGNGRQMNGTTSRVDLANPAHDAVFRLGADRPITIIGWVTLDSVLQTGSQRRTILAFEGATDAPADHTLYRLTVLNDGSLRYEHQDDLGNWTELATAPGTVRVGRYYSLALTRKTRVTISDDDAIATYNSDVTLYLNNIEVPWTLVTYNGAPTGATNLPIPSQYAVNAKLRIGYSAKMADAMWHGIVDELSIHKAARAKSPYLDSVYYRLTLVASFARLTSQGDIRTLGAVEMGGGSRWWCYERNRNLYVIRENSLGLYSKEVLLTTVGSSPVDVANPLSWLMSSGAEKPKLTYDPVSDTLIVAFISGGRVFKITAGSGDPPATVNMPVTASTVAIVKSSDQVDLLSTSVSGVLAQEGRSVGQSANGNGVTAPGIRFVESPTAPSFGVYAAASASYPGGVVLYQNRGNIETVYGVLRAPNVTGPNGGYFYFFEVPVRAPGTRYRAAGINAYGTFGTSKSGFITDWLGALRPQSLEDGGENALYWGRWGDFPTDVFSGGSAGEGAFYPNHVGRISRTPMKHSQGDSWTGGKTGSGDIYPSAVGIVSRTPLKLSFSGESFTGGNTGQSASLTMSSTGRSAQVRK